MNKNHENLIEELRNDEKLLEDFKLFFYDNKREGVMKKYNLTQLGCEKVLKTFDIKVPKELRNKRRKETCMKIYGAPTVFQSDMFWDKAKATSIEHFGTEYPNQNKEQYQKSLDTKELVYGSSTYNNIEKQKETVKNKSDEEKLEIRLKRTKTNMERYGGVAPACNSEVLEKMISTRTELKHWHTSKPENIFYDYLISTYGEDDICHPYRDGRYSREDGYMYECDFYVKSEDLFIELNIFPVHGTEPFDPDNIEHQQLLEHCKTNPSNWVEEGLVTTWAGSDYEKFNVRKEII